MIHKNEKSTLKPWDSTVPGLAMGKNQAEHIVLLLSSPCKTVPLSETVRKAALQMFGLISLMLRRLGEE